MADSTRLADEQLRTLARLTKLAALRRFYLAGGTAIAWHLGHRRSRDLDVFSQDHDIDLERAREALTHELPDSEVVSLTEAALRLRAGGTEIDLVRYPYPPLEPPRAGPEGFPVAGLLDLAVMKLAAIARRGIRRDFWDLFAILTTAEASLALKSVLVAYRTRFGVSQPDVYHVVRALTYFDDAERETVWPVGLTEAIWREIKRFFVAAAPSVLQP